MSACFNVVQLVTRGCGCGAQLTLKDQRYLCPFVNETVPAEAIGIERNLAGFTNWVITLHSEIYIQMRVCRECVFNRTLSC